MYKVFIKAKKDKRGFTLVELIVVLVILAILAAILVPTLIGYINKARDEKNYSAAQTVRVAAQSVIDEAYGASKLPMTAGTAGKSDTITAGSITLLGTSKEKEPSKSYAADVAKLSGVTVYDWGFNYDTDGKITEGYVEIDNGGAFYILGANGWSTVTTNSITLTTVA